MNKYMLGKVVSILFAILLVVVFGPFAAIALILFLFIFFQLIQFFLRSINQRKKIRIVLLSLIIIYSFFFLLSFIYGLIKYTFVPQLPSLDSFLKQYN